jgi:hypothetical protein
MKVAFEVSWDNDDAPQRYRTIVQASRADARGRYQTIKPDGTHTNVWHLFRSTYNKKTNPTGPHEYQHVGTVRVVNT